MKKLLIGLIDFYQTFISAVFFNGICRFEVSCSEYTKRQIRDIGAIRGSLTGMKRIWSCR